MAHKGRFWLTTMWGALLLLAVAGGASLIGGSLRFVEPAVAQIPDSGLQRRKLLAEAVRTNQLLGEIKQILSAMALHERANEAGGTGADGTPPSSHSRRR